MSDEKDTAAGSTEEPVLVAAAVVGDETGIEAEGAIAIQGTHALIVARFANMDAAKAAYEALLDAEVKRAIDIEGVLVANADYQGKVHVQKMTDHTTRKGLKWGLVGGVVLGVIFPPSILASAALVGTAGAVAGKVGNELKKGRVADELASVLTPGTSGILALVNVTAVDAVKQAMPEAAEVKAVPVTEDTADAIKAAAAAAGSAA